MSTVFDFTGFSPHGVCLAWQPGLIWLTAAASVMTATAYFSISAALIALLLRRPDFGYRGVAVLFATFILACGTTHVFGAVTLWVPLYWLSGAMDAVTAVLSVATAILLWPLIPQLVGLPSPRALREANRRLQAAEAVTAQANHWLAMGEQIAQVGHWRQNSAQDPMIWSDEMFRIFDLPHTGGEVSQAEMGATWHPEDRDIVSAAAAAAFRDGAGFDVSARALRPCGEIRHLRFRGSVQSSQDGKAGALFGICADRTEQAEIERQLHRARSDAMAANRRLEDLALQDALTGLANRRNFDSTLDREFRRARRTGATLALLMIDVDLFKGFNDRYGHPAGDICLQGVAAAICFPLRRGGDLAARYGGEEFAVILPGIDLAAARDVAAQIVQAVRDLGIPHADSASGVVTVSAGIAAMAPTPQGGEPKRLVELADQALYAAKSGGRDQVQIPLDLARNDMQRRDVETPARLGELPDWHRCARMPQAAAPGSPLLGMDFAGILEALPYGVVLTDASLPDNPIVFANAAFAILTGHLHQEIIGRNCRMLQGPQTDRAVVADLADAVRRGIPLRREVLNYTKGGQAFWNEVFLKPLTDASGALVGFLGTQRDVTELRLAQAAQHDLQTRLERIMDNLPGYIFQRVRKPDGTYGFSYFSRSYWHILGFADIPPLDTLDAYAHIHAEDVARVRQSVENSVSTLSEVTIEFRALAANGRLL